MTNYVKNRNVEVSFIAALSSVSVDTTEREKFLGVVPARRGLLSLKMWPPRKKQFLTKRESGLASNLKVPQNRNVKFRGLVSLKQIFHKMAKRTREPHR